eukprot:Nk52_evm24s1178 gene=Nk52_evmTU24s1178
MTLSLKVSIPEKSNIKNLAFDNDAYVYDIIKGVEEKIGTSDGLSDHAIFLPSEKNAGGIWLAPGRPLDYYNLNPNSLVEYRKKHVNIDIFLIDQQKLTIFVDQTLPGREFAELAGTQLGIYNKEEYSLAYQTGERTNNGAKRKSLTKQKSSNKQESISLNWIDPDKSMHEQGLLPDQTIFFLRKKFFFSDQNVSSSDKIQLDLLYLECREAYLTDKHPCSDDELITFAALMAQATEGDYKDGIHSTAFVKNSSILSEKGKKISKVEKKLLLEYKKFAGMSTGNAKFRFIQLARSLKTYGITFFKVRVDEKKKMVHAVFGVHRDKVILMDEKNREKKWEFPLTQVRRWMTHPEKLTLDFGDYSQSYRVLYTEEAVNISSLIGGYIDIVSQKRKGPIKQFPDQEAQGEHYEESVTSARATAVVNKAGNVGKHSEAGVARSGVTRMSNLGTVKRQGNMQHDAIRTMQKSLNENISGNLVTITNASSNLGQKVVVRRIGNDAMSQKWKEDSQNAAKKKVACKVEAITCAASELLSLMRVGEDELDYSTAAVSASVISSNLDDLAKAVKEISSFGEESDQAFHDAAQSLMEASLQLLTAAQNTQSEKDSDNDSLLASARSIGVASGKLLREIGQSSVSTQMEADIKHKSDAISGFSAELVSNALAVASKCENSVEEDDMIAAAQSVVSATDDLVTTTILLSPTMSSDWSTTQVINTAKSLQSSIETVLWTTEQLNEITNTDEDDIRRAANQLLKAINELVGYAKDCHPLKTDREAYFSSWNKLEDVLTYMKRSGINSDPLTLKEYIASLNPCIGMLEENLRALEKGVSGGDNNQTHALQIGWEAAKLGNELVGALNICLQSNCSDAELNIASKKLDALLDVVAKGVPYANVESIMVYLSECADDCCKDLHGVIAASTAGMQFNKNENSVHQVESQIKAIEEPFLLLVSSISRFNDNRKSPRRQLDLLNSSSALFVPCTLLMSSGRTSLGLISNDAASKHFANSLARIEYSLNTFSCAYSKANKFRSEFEICSSVEYLEGMLEELNDCIQQGSALEYLPDANHLNSKVDIGGVIKNLETTVSHMAKAAKGQSIERTGSAAGDLVKLMDSLLKSIRAFAVDASTDADRTNFLKNGIDATNGAMGLIKACSEELQGGSTSGTNDALSQYIQELQKVLSSIPEVKAIDSVIASIHRIAELLQNGPSGIPEIYKNAGTKESLYSVGPNECVALEASLTDLMQMNKGAIDEKSSAVKSFGENFERLFETTVKMIGLSDAVCLTEEHLHHQLNSLSSASIGFLKATKEVLIDQLSSTKRSVFSAAYHKLSSIIGNLMEDFDVYAPGQKACDDAIRNLKIFAERLGTAIDSPVLDIYDYRHCASKLVGSSKVLASSLSTVAKSLKGGHVSSIDYNIAEASDSAIDIAEVCMQAAYILSIADPSTTPATQGLLQVKDLCAWTVQVQDSSANITHSFDSPKDMDGMEKELDQCLQNIISKCCEVSRETDNEVAKSYFTETGNYIDGLRSDIKGIVANAVSENIITGQDQECVVEMFSQLDETLNGLLTYGSSSEFASSPGILSTHSKLAQLPILDAAENLLNRMLVQVAKIKELAIDPSNSDKVNDVIDEAKQVSNAIRNVVGTIQQYSPGKMESEDAKEITLDYIDGINAALMSSQSGLLRQIPGKTLQEYHDEVFRGMKEFQNNLGDLNGALQESSALYARNACPVASELKSLSLPVIGMASKTIDLEKQGRLLNQLKEVGNCMYALFEECRQHCTSNEAGKSVAIDASFVPVNDAIASILEQERGVDEEQNPIREYVVDIGSLLKNAISLDAICEIAKEQCEAKGPDSSIIPKIKVITGNLPRMVSAEVSQIPDIVRDISTEYTAVVLGLGNPKLRGISGHLLVPVSETGYAIKALFEKVEQIYVTGQDKSVKKAINESAKNVHTSINQLLVTINNVTRSSEECDEALEVFESLISDIDTNLMFATMVSKKPQGGSLVEMATDNLQKAVTEMKTKCIEFQEKHHLGERIVMEHIQKCHLPFSTLLEDIKETFQNSQLDPSSQILIFDALKDSIKRTSQVVSIVQAAILELPLPFEDYGVTSNIQAKMKDVEVSLDNLQETVKSVKTDFEKDLRSLEAAVTFIQNSISEANTELENSKSKRKTNSNLENSKEILQCLSEVSNAMAMFVQGSRSMDRSLITSSTQILKNAVTDLLSTLISMSRIDSTCTKLLRVSVKAGDEVISMLLCMKELLKKCNSKLANQNRLSKLPEHLEPSSVMNQLTAHSSAVTENISEITKMINSLTFADWVSHDDPTAAAERELYEAAQCIEQAARKLAELKPAHRPDTKKEDICFHEAILEAAKGITSAAAALVKVSTEAQKELVSEGKMSVHESKQKYHEDASWSDGLISAAKAVGQACSALCNAAQEMLQGNCTEEKMVSASKQVAASTVKLVFAFKVKADLNSANLQRLTDAGNAVKKATDDLVSSAKSSLSHGASDSQAALNAALTPSKGGVGYIAKEMALQEKIMLKEKELKEAREELASLRRNRYSGSSSNNTSDVTRTAELQNSGIKELGPSLPLSRLKKQKRKSVFHGALPNSAMQH